MENSYKLVITYGETYREVELPDEDISMRIGSTVRCDIRIAYEVGKEPFEMEISRQDGVWTLECQDNVYFTTGGVRKQIRKQLEHDDILAILLEASDIEICQINFLLDFDRVEKRYDRVIDIRNERNIVIGGVPNAAIYIQNDLVGADSIALIRRQGKLYLTDYNARYGAYINGIRVHGEQELHDTDFFSLVGYSFYYANGFLYADSSSGAKYSGLKAANDTEHVTATNYPKFIRNVRKKAVLSTEPITVLDPPTQNQKPKGNIFMQVLPALGSLILVVVLRGILGGGGTFVIFSACTMGLGIVTSIISHITGNKDYKKDAENREKEYNEYIQRKREEIKAARTTEQSQLNSMYWSANQELTKIHKFSGDLFDRQTGDEDYLQILIGTGPKEAKRPIKITEKESITVADQLAKIPAKVRDEFAKIPNAPVYLEVITDNAIGVIADQNQRFEMLKLMTLDVVVRQYYNDVRLFFIISENDTKRLDWAKWLPNVTNDELGIRNIGCDNGSRKAIYDYLYVELQRREEQKYHYPNFIVFVLDSSGVKEHSLADYISKAKTFGVTFIFFEERQELLPQWCEEVVQLHRGATQGQLVQVEDINKTVTFTFRPIQDSQMLKAARTLSPIYSEEVSLENSITKSISMFEMLGIISPEDIDLEENWKRSAIHRSMAAPIGVKSGNEIVYLDIHEKAHGPHGLVAGTTGYGKSELLQTYILSMAVLYHPYEVNFVIIDFKGGGMAFLFGDLPHLVGKITNIDGRDLQRSLKSIKAELLKRQRLFVEAGVNKIDEYITLYKHGDVSTPLPHLVIVVDEFAELKAQQPDFMNELVSAARIGRSLGVHLILATQNPAGQVAGQIQDNTRFQLCLKLASKQASSEVIHSPLAYEIREKGRAYIRVGSDEIFELFQSAYSGGAAITPTDNEKPFEINEISFNGRKRAVYSQTSKKSDEHIATQLTAITSYIKQYCDDNGIKQLPNICLPALKEYITIPDDAPSYDLAAIPIGIYDDPDNQYQGLAKVDICNDNTVVIGSSMTGKTNLLQTIIRMVSEKFSPSEATFYIADFGTMYLKNYEELCHVGGVVLASEEEKFKNLFKLLIDELNSRKEIFVNNGLSSYAAYLEAGFTGMPHIFLLIDNFSIYKEMYSDDYDDQFLYLCREGITCGISIIITNASTSGFGSRYLLNFANRFAFQCNDSNEYSNLDYGRMEPKAVPGRMLFKKDKEGYEVQVFIAFEGTKEIERSNAVKTFIAQTNELYPYQMAKRIPAIPDHLTLEYLRNNYGYKATRNIYPVALDYENVDIVSLNFNAVTEFCIIGKDGGRKTAALTSILTSVKSNALLCPVTIFLFDNVERKLKDYSKLSIVEKYTIDASEITAVFDTIMPELESRRESVVSGDVDDISRWPLLLFIINSKDAVEYISNDKDLLDIYIEINKRFKGLGIAFVFSDIDDATVSYSGPELIKRFKENKKAIITSDLRDFQFCDLPSQVVRNNKTTKPGDAFMMDGSDISKIKLLEEG